MNTNTINNWIVRSMKKELTAFQSTACRLTKTKKANLDVYKPEMAEKQNAILDTELQTAFDKAGTELWKIMSDCSLRLGRWNAPNPRLITKDETFFNGDYTISSKELNDFVEMYRFNAQMTKIIKAYIDKNKIRGYYIPTAEEKLAKYEKMYNSALSMLNTIYSNPNANVEMWSAENNVSLDLVVVIGDGEELHNVDMLRYESTISPLKEYPAPVHESFNFSFMPIMR